MKKLLIVLSVLTLLLAGCTAAPKETEPQPQITTPTGVGDAVVPEEGDIVIPINP